MSLPVPQALRRDSREPALQGATTRITWGSRTDVGLVREHNEDSFLVAQPLFCVCDGMGGHEAGEVASAIAVHTIAATAPATADDTQLGAAVEAANTAVIQGATTGEGRPGMGCTATAAIIEDNRIAVAHVGDSRLYLLHGGNLVRLTHDHSYVEELVDAGEITADEARTHPSRSIITRALGNDPDMYADHFTLPIERGDRVILCSDGLSSMISDNDIEATAVCCPTPQQCADDLVDAALEAGGSDNVTVVVVDVTDDGVEELHRRARRRSAIAWLVGILCILAVFAVGLGVFVNSSYYVGNNSGTVGIYHGVHASVLGVQLSALEEETAVSVDDLPVATQKSLSFGISASSIDAARSIVASYQAQIDADKSKASEAASSAKSAAATEAAAAASAEAAAQAQPATTSPATTSGQEG